MWIQCVEIEIYVIFLDLIEFPHLNFQSCLVKSQNTKEWKLQNQRIPQYFLLSWNTKQADCSFETQFAAQFRTNQNKVICNSRMQVHIFWVIMGDQFYVSSLFFPTGLNIGTQHTGFKYQKGPEWIYLKLDSKLASN